MFQSKGAIILFSVCFFFFFEKQTYRLLTLFLPIPYCIDYCRKYEYDRLLWDYVTQKMFRLATKRWKTIVVFGTITISEVKRKNQQPDDQLLLFFFSHIS